MASQLRLTYSLIFIALFSIAIVSFAINFANDNNSAINLGDDPELNLLETNINSNLSGFRGSSQNTYQSIINSAVAEGSETTQTGGQFAITPLNVIPIVSNIIKVGYIKIFGSSNGFSIFMTTFIALLTMTMAFIIIKSWIGRSPVD